MFKLIKEAVIDIPRRTYAKDVFDNADTENPKLKQSILDIINTQLKEFEKLYPIKKYSLVGSSITKHYRDDADLDINVLFDVAPADREAVRIKLSHQLRGINGKLIPGTKHPINYYIITDPNVKETNDKMADGVFDIKNNTWFRKPKEFKFDANRYAADFEKKVKEIDVVEGELKRDIIDYKELSELNPDDVLNLQEIINDKISQIEDDIKQLVSIGNTVLKDRQDAFATDMTPEEIKTFGKKNLLPKNVIYKMLEKYHYLKLYHQLKDILDDGKITDAEIRSIQTESYNSRYTMPTGKRDAFRGDYFGKSAEKEINKRIFNISEKKITFTFGRFNPPTIGHEKLLQKVASLGTDYKIFLSRSQDPIKNPLSPSDKLKWMTTIFRQYASHIMIMPTNMVLELATKIYQLKYTNITMVVGSDRVSEFKSILTKYNNEYNRHGFYNFEKINVVSAGERDPDEEGVTGMSASKLRNYASRGDLRNFKRGIPGNLTEKQKNELFFDVRKGMGLSVSLAAEFEPTEMPKTLQQFETQQVRDLYIREMIFNIGEQAHNVNLDVKGKVVRRGTNYIVLEDTNNNLHKSWIWDCIPIAADKEVMVREYNLDIDYGFKAVSEIKETKEEPKLVEERRKKVFGELKKDLIKMTKKEAYDIGHDYAQHTSKITPGEPGYDPNYQGGEYVPSNAEDNKELIATTRVYPDGDKIPNSLPPKYMAANSKEVPEGQQCNNCEYYVESNTYCKKFDAKVRDNYWCAKWEPNNKKVSMQDIEEWAGSNDTIDKYRQRYGDNYQSKIDEVKQKMMSFKDYTKKV
jgi:nicotinamide mononucleotide adenylyltransferase